MKITKDETTGWYVVSELGRILHVVPTLNDATRLVGMEPEYEPEVYNCDDSDEEFDLMELLK